MSIRLICLTCCSNYKMIVRIIIYDCRFVYFFLKILCILTLICCRQDYCYSWLKWPLFLVLLLVFKSISSIQIVSFHQYFHASFSFLFFQLICILYLRSIPWKYSWVLLMLLSYKNLCVFLFVMFILFTFNVTTDIARYNLLTYCFFLSHLSLKTFFL